MRQAPSFWSRRGGTALALAPLGWLYAGGGMLRRMVARPYRAAIPVICVGNAVAGGAGKTPVVRAIARHLLAAGHTPAIVSRGYGGSLAGPLRVDPHHRAAEVGDEPRMLAVESEVWIGADRAAAVRSAERHGAGMIVMDDGLQNPGVRKSLSLLVVDGESGIGNGLILPAGPLREPFSSARRRADALIVIGPDRQGLSRRAGEAPVFAATLQPEADALVPDRRYLAFAGIGRPEKFFATLRGAGASLADAVAFPDHHPFTEAELLRLSIEAASLGAALITTEKDAVRLPPVLRDTVAVLRVELAFERPDAFWRWFDARLAAVS